MWAPPIFLGYIVIMRFILFNLLLAIFNDSFAQVHVRWQRMPLSPLCLPPLTRRRCPHWQTEHAEEEARLRKEGMHRESLTAAHLIGILIPSFSPTEQNREAYLREVDKARRKKEELLKKQVRLPHSPALPCDLGTSADSPRPPGLCHRASPCLATPRPGPRSRRALARLPVWTGTTTRGRAATRRTGSWRAGRRSSAGHGVGAWAEINDMLSACKARERRAEAITPDPARCTIARRWPPRSLVAHDLPGLCHYLRCI